LGGGSGGGGGGGGGVSHRSDFSEKIRLWLDKKGVAGLGSLQS
jgi:hypothetical protein